MNNDDLEYLRLEQEDGHKEYWFSVSGKLKEKLEREHAEMCMVGIDVGIDEVVYSQDEDIVGVKRTFPFNFDVVISDDDELKRVLCMLSKDV